MYQYFICFDKQSICVADIDNIDKVYLNYLK
jgi:hypothetical protein